MRAVHRLAGDAHRAVIAVEQAADDVEQVDLPQPDGPITPKNSPGWTDSDTLSTAVRTPSGVSNCLVMFVDEENRLRRPRGGLGVASGRHRDHGHG